MIRAQNLTKFFGTVAAVRDISFEIKRGEIVAFLAGLEPEQVPRRSRRTG